MSALAVVLLELFCCLGLGAAALRALRIDGDLGPGEHWALAFAVGLGVLGWLVFPLGIAGFLSPPALSVLLSAGAAGTLLLRESGRRFAWPAMDAVGRGLLAVVAVALIFDLVEGLAPPADADTLAYHFTVPLRFVEAGRIGFIVEPIEGAVPFLVHMSYVPALALGGERALTLWTLVSGWAPAALLFVLCRRHLGFNWSLAVALIFVTMPAVIYGGGSGQVETRIALFVMVAAWATARALETGQVRYAVLAGLGSGFFAAAKYTGLLFAAATGAVVVMQRRWLAMGALFGAALLAAGFQWYGWNAAHTGDPVFPMLFQWLGRDDLALWTKAHDLVFKANYFHAENRLPATPLLLVLYPFKATLDFSWMLDAGRVGFGPYGLLVLPFAALGVWRFRDQVRGHPLLVYASVCALFYVLWFFVGGSQRVRHLLPVLPLLLICMTVAAERRTAGGNLRLPLAAAVAATVLIQIGGHVVFAVNHFKFIADGMNRERFLQRNVTAYVAVPWVNDNLGKTDRVFIHHRQLRYYLEVPNLFGTVLQAVVEVRPDHTDAQRLYRQLRSAGVTHFLVAPDTVDGRIEYPQPLGLLAEAGCLDRLKRFHGRRLVSRTLPTLRSEERIVDVLRLANEDCLR